MKIHVSVLSGQDHIGTARFASLSTSYIYDVDDGFLSRKSFAPTDTTSVLYLYF
jgi:hypothetical protein